jgi:hypothetical protein
VPIAEIKPSEDMTDVVFNCLLSEYQAYRNLAIAGSFAQLLQYLALALC